MYFDGYHYPGTTFEQSYRCYPASFIDKPQIESGDKIPFQIREELCSLRRHHRAFDLSMRLLELPSLHLELVFREMIASAIAEHDLSYSFVEYRKIREALAYANPRIQFWCRNTVVSDVLKIFENEKAQLRKTLSELPGRICLTTDLWKAITVEGYLCLTVHYVEAWKLQAKILAFVAFPSPHTGFSIATRVMELMKEWGLEKKVFTVTVDNASSNDNMQGILKTKLRRDLVCGGEFLHVRCAEEKN